MNNSEADVKTFTALITGGERGIGAAITQALRQDGITCTVTGRSKGRPTDLHPDVNYEPLDFLVQRSVEDFLGYACEDLKPDILVNNAGFNLVAPIAEMSSSLLRDIMEVNLIGPYLLTQACLPAMIANEWGRIVNISSIWSVIGNSGNSAYCASKFGIDGFTASLASEVADKGVLVNAVAPGYTATEALKSKYSQRQIEEVSRHIPVGRLGEPEEVAELVSWLVSPKNGYVSGQNICVDGGLTRTSHPLRRWK
ncbi:SDR family oxidoreductase [Halomonas sp. ATCH28]|uniref:SDR family oxidoreductase n=1 Tax=Halomonas gemina TaxID=2945105 RepID=A0ABT0T3M5_9GAMM|nr:SDR family oxidoreductase [Halomonas gemina]MCL7941524.1 SDR family oxidoreductase [Halomonas gemina]